MKPDDLTWLAAELGMRVLDEAPLTEPGNAAEDEWLVERIRSALGGRVGAADVARAVLGVRNGRPSMLPLAAAEGHGGPVGEPAPRRALLTPGTPGRLLLMTDASTEPAADRTSLEHRASIADAAAAMAHEIANATGAIAGWSKLAASADSDVSPERALALIARAADAANQAARRLLRLAAGDMAEPLEPLDASAAVADLVALLGTVAREANVRLEAQIPPDLHVRASVATLFSVVWNLTKNAIEATRVHGTVAVRLHSQAGHVLIEVADQGPGISPEAQARIFDKYVTTKATGTGLGLPLVKSIVTELGGVLSVDSQLGSGSVFRVALPSLAAEARHVAVAPLSADALETGPVEVRRRAAGPASATTDDSQRVTTLPRRNQGAQPDLDADILIVEDDDSLRDLMATFLALRGARVTEARNIHEARNVTGHYDIALIDLALDECRGDELLASLRRRGIVSAAMLVTGSVQKPRIIAGGEPDDWVRKPFEITELVARIQRTLARHAMLGAAVGQSAGA